MTIAINAAVRLFIWGLTVIIALVPALHLSHVDISFIHFRTMAYNIYAAAGFDHFYFAIVIMSAFGLSNIIDNVFRRRGIVIWWIEFICIIMAIVFICVLVLGTLHYGDMPSGPHADVTQFSTDYNTVVSVLAGGAFVEFVIACSH